MKLGSAMDVYGGTSPTDETGEPDFTSSNKSSKASEDKRAFPELVHHDEENFHALVHTKKPPCDGVFVDPTSTGVIIWEL